MKKLILIFTILTFFIGNAQQDKPSGYHKDGILFDDAQTPNVETLWYNSFTNQYGIIRYDRVLGKFRALENGVWKDVFGIETYTIAERDAMSLGADDRKLIYVVDTGVNELQIWDGDSWETLGSGGGLSNPLTEDLNAGGYEINNVLDISTNEINVSGYGFFDTISVDNLNVNEGINMNENPVYSASFVTIKNPPGQNANVGNYYLGTLNGNLILKTVDGVNGSSTPVLTVNSSTLQTGFGNYEFPRQDGTAGQVLTTDGSGQVTFEDITSDVFVTPEDYGAVGDGVTDDTSAIESAINTGKTIAFKNSSYKISSLITLTDDLFIDGKGVNFIGAGLDSNISIFGFSSSSINLTLKNINFSDTKFVVETSNSNNIVIEGCSISNAAGLLACKGYDTTGFLTVENCTFDNVEIGVTVQSGSFKSAQFNNNVFTNVQYQTLSSRPYPLDKEIVSAIWYQSLSGDTSVFCNNNYVEDVTGKNGTPTTLELHGIGISLSDTDNTECIISNNTVINVSDPTNSLTSGHEGLMGRGRYVIMESNILYDAGGVEGCIYAKGSYYHKITNNVIDNSLTNPRIGEISGVISTSSNCDISNNKISNCYIGITSRSLKSNYKDNEFINIGYTCFLLSLETGSTHVYTNCTENVSDEDCIDFFVVTTSTGSTYGDIIIKNNKYRSQGYLANVTDCDVLEISNNTISKNVSSVKRDLINLNGLVDLFVMKNNNIYQFEDTNSTGRIFTGNTSTTPRIIFENNYVENGHYALWLRDKTYTDLIVRNNDFFNCNSLNDSGITVTNKDIRVNNVGGDL